MGARDVFVDTAGFFALWDASDGHHEDATRLGQAFAGEKRRLVTTDYVADETATLLRLRHSHESAADFLDAVERSAWLQVEWTGPDRFGAAARFFKRHSDKSWSFTDCVSFVVMRELRIRDAFTSDHHFEQAGFVSLLKS